MKLIEEDVLTLFQEGSSLVAGATPSHMVSELQLLPPNEIMISDSLAKASLGIMVFGHISNLPAMLPIFRRGAEQSRLWVPVTPPATACRDAIVTRAAILHVHDACPR